MRGSDKLWRPHGLSVRFPHSCCCADHSQPSHTLSLCEVDCFHVLYNKTFLQQLHTKDVSENLHTFSLWNQIVLYFKQCDLGTKFMLTAWTPVLPYRIECLWWSTWHSSNTRQFLGGSVNLEMCAKFKMSASMNLQHSLQHNSQLDAFVTYEVKGTLTPMLTWLNLLKPTGHVMHQQFNIQQFYILPKLHLCVLYLSENKQWFVPLIS